jgi:alkanesulfonate monooxygenase SsuD/methylene tetrahydromethanopterin reductase-like flavin-dependent oxidoreductase (luciferase family)
VLSEGRLLPAFGIGSPTGAEWSALNIDTRTRGGKTDEGLEIIRRLWAEDEVSFDGKHYKLTKASINPKPVQPDLPMWIGGSSEAAIRRTAKFGTGWQASAETPADVAPLVQAIRTQSAALGRSIDEDHFGIGIPFRFGRPDDAGVERVMETYRKRTNRDPRDYFAIGDANTVLDRIRAYVDAGLSKFVLRPAAAGADDLLEQTRLVVEKVLPVAAQRWPKVKKAVVT